uniref:Ribosomal protein L34 n=1 Tax=Romanomermis culicivorax TaxID=13658 RepID=A0A915HXG2_ROMCU
MLQPIARAELTANIKFSRRTAKLTSLLQQSYCSYKTKKYYARTGLGSRRLLVVSRIGSIPGRSGGRIFVNRSSKIAV